MSLGKTFWGSTSLLLAGTVAAQAITFLLSFLLARIYAPDDFGRFSVFVGFAGALGAAATGAFDRVILLGESLAEGRRAATLTLLCATVVACLVAVLGCALAQFSPLVLPLPFIDIVLFLPLFIIFYGAAQAFVYGALRSGAVRALAGLKVAQSAAMGSVQLVAAGLSHVSGLILGNLVGWSMLAIAGLHWRLKHRHIRGDLKFNSLVQTARTHWRYPRYTMPNELLDNISNQVPILLIGSIASLSLAGHYGLALMMLSAPAALAGQAVGQSFMQYLGGQGEAGIGIRRAMFQIWAVLAGLGILPFAAILGFGPDIFAFAFGANWREAGHVAQALSVLLFVRFISSPTSTVYLKLGMQQYQWRFCLLAVVYRSAAYSLLAFDVSLQSVIIIHVVAECLAIAGYNYVALRELERRGAAA